MTQTAQTREALVEVMLTAMSEHHSGNFAEAAFIVEAQLAALEAAGVRLVPEEATSPMVEQGAHHAFARWMPNESVQDNYDIARAQWRAMLSASPYKAKDTP